MCGIAGLVTLNRKTPKAQLMHRVTAVTDALRNRGPDDQDYWSDARYGVALGHRRLSIIDLSPLGRQPMASQDKRYMISFNGEIYNYKDLRRQLEARGTIFRGQSDTEVLLEAIAHWGVPLTLQKANGMFALALWDAKDKTITLACDRIGKKPLYFGWVGEPGHSDFVFASELKGLRAHEFFSKQISREALSLYVRHAYVPAPFSIYEGVYKLSPASIFTCSIDELPKLRTPNQMLKKVKTFWSAKRMIAYAQRNRYMGTPEAAVLDLQERLQDAVSLRRISDVPLGAFLSGGVDSSLIVALMQAQSSQPIKTFTIGFEEAAFDEARYAAKVAEHLKTDHTALYLTPKDAMDVIPSLPEIYDEPFADVSQIPTYLVSKLARSQVTVALSGDAGDELFGGYNRYIWGRKVKRFVDWVPYGTRRWMARRMTGVRPQTWDKLMRFQPQAGDKIYKLARVLSLRSSADIYKNLTSFWPDVKQLVDVAHVPVTVAEDESQWPEFQYFEHLMMYLDLMTYLPGDILTKVDRASMAVGLEARNPLLDPRVVEFAWSLPLSYKLRGGQSKWPLRQLLKQFVPDELINRPKKGFDLSIGQWLRGPLREWGEDLLDYKTFQDQGFIDPHPVKMAWKEHQDGTRNWQYQLWVILMLQAWLRKYW